MSCQVSPDLVDILGKLMHIEIALQSNSEVADELRKIRSKWDYNYIIDVPRNDAEAVCKLASTLGELQDNLRDKGWTTDDLYALPDAKGTPIAWYITNIGISLGNIDAPLLKRIRPSVTNEFYVIDTFVGEKCNVG